jgi:hypothetical protein
VILAPVVLPLFVIDGLVSDIRTYSPKEFMSMVEEVDPTGKFEWTVKEQLVDGVCFPFTSYIGVPKKGKHE